MTSETIELVEHNAGYAFWRNRMSKPMHEGDWARLVINQLESGDLRETMQGIRQRLVLEAVWRQAYYDRRSANFYAFVSGSSHP